MLIKYSEALALLNNLSLGTNEWKGLDYFVSTVPGCKIETIDKGNWSLH